MHCNLRPVEFLSTLIKSIMFRLLTLSKMSFKEAVNDALCLIMTVYKYMLYMLSFRKITIITV